MKRAVRGEDVAAVLMQCHLDLAVRASILQTEVVHDGSVVHDVVVVADRLQIFWHDAALDHDVAHVMERTVDFERAAHAEERDTPARERHARLVAKRLTAAGARGVFLAHVETRAVVLKTKRKKST